MGKIRKSSFRGVGDAKSIALSESEIASATGPLSILYNPSLLNNSDIKKIVYSHQERFFRNSCI